MRKSLKFILVEDEPGLPESIHAHLVAVFGKVEVLIARSKIEAEEILAVHNDADVLVLDLFIMQNYRLKTSDDLIGLTLLRPIKNSYPDMKVVVYTSNDEESVREYIRGLNYTYVFKSKSENTIKSLIEVIKMILIK